MGHAPDARAFVQSSPLWARSMLQRDTTIAVALALTAAAISFLTSRAISPEVYKFYDLFYQADPVRVIEQFSDVAAKGNGRSTVHPIFSLLAFSYFSVLRFLGFSTVTIMQIYLAGCGAASVSLIYFTLRNLSIGKIGGVLSCCIFMSSATYIHWFAIPETYPLAAVTICLAFLIMSRPTTGKSLLPWILASMSTLAVTTTNFVSSASCAFFVLRFREFLKVVILSIIGVILLALLQAQIFSSSALFFTPNSLAQETAYIETPDVLSPEGRWKLQSRLRTIFLTSAVAPEPEINRDKFASLQGFFVDNQHSGFGRMTTSGKIASIIWLFLVATGAITLAVYRRQFMKPAVVFMSFQVALHVVYGSVTFLYACHYFPVLLLAAGNSFASALRRPALIASCLFILTAGYNNVARFEEAAVIVNSFAETVPSTDAPTL